jgi:hypothetical protein
MSFLELLDKIDANGRRPIVNSCAREDPVGAAATAIKIAWSLNSRDEAWEPEALHPSTVPI